jgi:hypothetical protein
MITTRSWLGISPTISNIYSDTPRLPPALGGSGRERVAAYRLCAFPGWEFLAFRGGPPPRLPGRPPRRPTSAAQRHTTAPQRNPGQTSSPGATGMETPPSGLPRPQRRPCATATSAPGVTHHVTPRAGHHRDELAPSRWPPETRSSCCSYGWIGEREPLLVQNRPLGVQPSLNRPSLDQHPPLSDAFSTAVDKLGDPSAANAR